MSLGIVQQTPTQFDEPFYRYLAKETELQFVVYYFGAGRTTIEEDPEIQRYVGWGPTSDRRYVAKFCLGTKPLEFARQVVQARHDLIIISGYNQPHALYTALMAKAKGVPAGLRSDNVLPQNGGTGRLWLMKRSLYPLLFRLYTTAHPVGQRAGEYLMRFGFKRESLFRFPYAVDHQWFARECSKCRVDLAKVRASWGLPEDGQVVCGVMKFLDREDPITLVKAFKKAKETLPAISLLLVGDGPLRTQVEEAAGELLGKSIVSPGYQDYAKLPSAYAASDLFVHTARGAWEVSVNEALACGLPVVTSDAVGSAWELIIPEGFGYTFKHGNVDELAQRMISVLGDSQLLARTREQGLKSLETWQYPATADRLISAMSFAKRAS